MLKISAIKSRTVKLLPQNEINGSAYGDELYERPPEFDPQFNVEYRSPVLMRIMLVVVNLAALIFSRSFLQSWYSVHGTTPVWIPLAFLLVPLGSLFIIYYYMGRVGSEIIIKLICFAFCAAQVFNIFSPIDTKQITLGKNGFSSDFGYVTEAGNIIGIAFPADGSATTVDSIGLKDENKSAVASLKSFIKREKLYSCTDVIYKPEKAEEFESFIERSPLWLSEIPDKINGLKYSLIDTSGYNLFIFFNCESKAYNTLPDSGKHTVYQVMYNLQNHEMRIIKYTKIF